MSKRDLTCLLPALFMLVLIGTANAGPVTYDLVFAPLYGHTGGTGTIVADITGNPATSSVVSVQAEVDGFTFANDFVAGDLSFSATDLSGFVLAVGSGVASPQEIIPIPDWSLLAYPFLHVGTTYYSYAIWRDPSGSDVYAPFSMERAPAVPVPSALVLVGLGSGLVGLVRRRWL